jgi:flagellar biosynthesis protein FlhG
VLPAGSGTADMGRPDHGRRAKLGAALAELSERYDLVLGDSAAGIGPDVLAWAAAADLVLLVTTPEPAALTDAFGLMKALDAWSLQNGCEVPTPELVVNLARGADEAQAIALKLRSVCERFLARAPRLAGWLPDSSEVRGAIASQAPFALQSPKSLATRCLGKLGERLARLGSPTRRAPVA